jgi:PAS domain S-box-containing protein
LKIELGSDGHITSKQELDLPEIFDQNEIAVSTNFSKTGEHYGILTSTGRIFKKNGEHFNRITHNYTEPLKYGSSIHTDYNGDFWIASDLQGIYKVSKEAFTKIQLHPNYTLPNIQTVARTVYGDVILGIGNGTTQIGNIIFNKAFEEHDVQSLSVNQIDERIFICTDKGLYLFNGGENHSLENIAFEGERTEIIFEFNDILLTNVIGQGLIEIDPISFEFKSTVIPHLQASHTYSMNINKTANTLYVGTNAGIFKVTKEKDQLKSEKLKIPKAMGSYAGLSTKDKYDNIWFTLDNGLVCILSDGSFKMISEKKVIRTNLIYTLNSDKFGNLILGTNKGLVFLEVNAKGDVLKHQQFDHNSGFDGYETNMRASYTDKKTGIIYLGTIEGLFAVDPALIQNFRKPIAPSIFNLTANDTTRSSSREFVLNVNNSKLPVYSYQYRVMGYENNWITITNVDRIKIEGLSDGDYELEVKASFDGKTYGPINIFKFNVDLPIWKSNWFILLSLLLFLGFNLFLLNQNKSFKSNQILDTKDIVISVKMAPAILLFSTVAVITMHILVLLVDSSAGLDIGPSLMTAAALAILYALSLSAKDKGQHRLNYQYLVIALTVITIHIFYELYVTRLHPYYIVAIVVTAFLSPYILSKIRNLIYYVLAILVASVLLTSILNFTVYPKVYFLAAMIILACVAIIVSYIRLDALEKLIFVSGLVNKGDFPAISFDSKGIINYVSENIANFIDSNHSELLGKHISILNNFVPYEGSYREKDVTTEFKEGQKYLVPMKNSNGEVNWLEWSFKTFKEDVKVIQGQNVSDKLELENTYELLVQSAEDLIFRCDTFGNFIFMNEVSFRKLGYTKEELLGKRFDHIVREDFKEKVMEFHWGKLTETERTKYMEFPVIAKDGTEIWTGQYVTRTFKPGSDVPNGYIAVARDITARLEMDRLMYDQRQSITSSINYAKRIQDRLLPHERQFKVNFRDHFVLCSPKDIVSGDFYWYHKIDDLHVVVLGDCTGHGVPGSFLTLLGMNMLNSIVIDRKHTDPGQILNELNARLIRILSKEEEVEMNDGMEVIVCVFSDDDDQLSYATAGGRFLIYNLATGFSMHKGDNQHIGDNANPDFESYKTHFAKFDTNDQLTLFTDGFQDQFGGQNDKKFYFRNLLELLEENMDKELNEQRDIYTKALNEWKGDREQTDDVTILSILK